MSLKQCTKEMFVLIAGSSLSAAAFHFFVIPDELLTGGLTGIAMMLSHTSALSMPMILLLLNIVLIIIGILALGSEFGVKTAIVSMFNPIGLFLLEQWFPLLEPITREPFLNMICFCFITSLSQAILILDDASGGGVDIIAVILHKYLKIEVGQGLALASITILLSGILVYDLENVILGIIGAGLNSFVLDKLLFGMKEKKKVCIISDYHEQIREYIISELGITATYYDVTGAYYMQTKRELMTIVDRYEFKKLVRYVRNLDSNAFISVYTVKEIIARPRRNES